MGNKKLSKSILNSILMGNKSYIILLLLIVVMSFLSPIFMTSANVLNILRQVSVIAIACAGFTLIMGSGHMDLSVGMILCFCGVVAAKLIVAGTPLVLVILITFVMGAVLGGINAAIISIFKISGFIVTLATSYVFKGIAFVITKNVPVTGLTDEFIRIGQGYLGPIPIPIIIMFVALAVMWVIINRTKFGRHAIAMGGNMEAARVSGVRVYLTRLLCFAILGVFTGLAAIVQTARSASAQLSAGSDLLMDAIAAVVIGGTNLHGGNANVFGSLVGALIVGIVNNGLNLLHVEANWQIAAKGILILIAVMLDVMSTNVYSKLSKKSI